ncbi:carbon starvation CstA family protein [Alysiella filiformis]|uniref:Carbon starvation protein CstA n=1 Tax=Alysiella filiformis DSM 16848 TaxID=1120981 RepID=A0A286E1J1_9NEIS|nr:carbon starvation protein A [Alysiella filiformis]QMT30744.1 carbon starvation protein A [Alysiella filiformis]UBQ56276.1 carbon starvation protein A [Alysiella filiformis DSM 16848]SOD64753.1 Carbon starvation protein CstA [Alysiella filiformis DSM 16848]
MMWFLICVALLLLGYFFYSKVIEKIFVIRPERQTPAYSMTDGVDYVPMSKKRVWLIQLLNIAGTGPIFGPILGALYGPVAMLWIVFACIFAGAVQDYLTGMLSIRNGGANVPYLAGKYLGNSFKHFMNVLSVVLLVLVGVVFVASPASLLTNITSDLMTAGSVGAAAVNDEAGVSASKANILVIWTVIIFVYYIIATLVPIDKIIGRIYPIFGGLLLFMTCGMFYGLVVNDIPFFRTLNLSEVGIVEFFKNLHPKDAPIFPLLFVTITCGAISGFHATQTPLMARCSENEKEGRFIFYGAMIAEGIIALIWCMVGLSFYDSTASFQEALLGTPSKVVYDSAVGMLGLFGGILAVLGVVILPITSGDTAFRAARLMIAEWLNMEQKSLDKRLMISVPLFVVGFIISKIDFQILWRYFSWANQTTAMITLWVVAAYLYSTRKNHWVATIPAVFMTMVCNAFILNAKIGFNLPYDLSVWVGVISGFVSLVLFLKFIKPREDDV